MYRKLSSLGDRIKKQKRGQAQILFIFMMGVIAFFMGYALAPSVNDVINDARGQSYEGYYYDTGDGMYKINESVNINCSSADISNQGKSICTQLDVMKPFWVGLIFGLGAMALGGIAVR